MSVKSSCASDIWRKSCEILKEKLSVCAFEQWFQCIIPVSIDDDEMALGVSDDFYAEWIQTNYGDVLNDAMEISAGKKLKISFKTGYEPQLPKESPSALVNKNNEKTQRQNQISRPAKTAPNCLERHTFENFVVGEENRYAYTAAFTVANSPGVYNPLYIYGSCGLGKTHLLQAVAHKTLQNKPGANVIYVTCEGFLNEYVDSLRNKTDSEFRRRFRSADVMMVDDVHQLAGKERLQEEFFNTFNALYNANKQIIMTSDKQPSEIHGLEERLVSRFESGVPAEIYSPSLETRLAILRMKQEEQLIKLDEEVLFFIASRICSNVRRLEGALCRLVAYSSAMPKIRITVKTAEDLLSRILEEESINRKVSIENILKTVSTHFNLHISDILGKKRPRNIAEPRMIAMYLCRKMTQHSLPEIGHAFGKNHVTILHAVNKISSDVEKNEGIRRVVSSLQRQIQN